MGVVRHDGDLTEIVGNWPQWQKYFAHNCGEVGQIKLAKYVLPPKAMLSPFLLLNL